MDYNSAFQGRVQQFLYAVGTYPEVMEEEHRLPLERLGVEHTHVFVDVGGNGAFAKYLPSTVVCHKLDFNKEFADSTGCIHTSHDSLPLPSLSVDRIMITAFVHHFSNEERVALYKECYRILKPGGILMVGDVVVGSPQDCWLNGTVNAHNSRGHKGDFFTPADAIHVSEVGFGVEQEHLHYAWKFRSNQDMLDYMKNLFGMDLIKKEDLQREIESVLHPVYTDDGVRIPWQLLYFVATKPM